jgi:UDP-3-O-[3-hydroxymyristoyl] glucosamine N-acyltransferase
LKLSTETIIKILEEPHLILGKNRTFKNYAPISNASKDDIAFCVEKGLAAVEEINKTKANVVVGYISIPQNLLHADEKTVILVENPRLAYIRILKRFFEPRSPRGVHPTAIIGQDCLVDEDIFIGPNVVVGDNVAIGKGTEIHANVYIHRGVKIGRNVILKPGCVIGSAGFGFEKTPNGSYLHFPQLASVVIEDDVSIGANTCVDRGTLIDTRIQRGTKIDNLVHIAHNVNIGSNCVIICQTCVAGSVTIGEGSWIAPGVTIRDGVKIGKNVLIGMGAVVTNDVPDDDKVFGVPARSIASKQF